MGEISIFNQTTSVTELIAMLTGGLGVYLTIRQSVWCFPVGIINVSIYALLFFSPGIQLYADALLQCIYILLLIYGWYKWTLKKKKILIVKPALLKTRTAFKLSAITILATCILALFLQTYTDASFPWFDSALTCASLAAQWMIAKKILENWIAWIIIDLLYVPLYIAKHLPLTAILYFIFFLLAIKGYREWKLTMHHEK